MSVRKTKLGELKILRVPFFSDEYSKLGFTDETTPNHARNMVRQKLGLPSRFKAGYSGQIAKRLKEMSDEEKQRVLEYMNDEEEEGETY